MEAHERLLTHLHGAGEQKEVTRAARQLLQSFPEHQIALEILAEDAFRAERSEEAVALQQRVARTRPHDERVLSKLDSYQLGLARFRAQHGKFDEARALLGAQLAKEDTGSSRYDILCRLAAVEIKAGDAERGQQVFEQACQSAPKPLAAVFRMLIESHRLPLDAAYRRTFDQEFSNGLRGEPDGPTALAMLSTVSAFQRAGITYGGLQTHRRRVFGYLKHAQDVPFSRAELVEICQSLMPFPNDKHVVHFATRGRQEYPDDPHFPYFLAMHHISLGPKKCPFTRVKALLESALALAKHAPDAHDLAEAINAARSFLEMGRLSYQLERDLRRPGPGAVFDALADILGLQGQEDAFDAIECEGKLDREKAPPKPRKRTADPQQRSLWDDF